MKITDEQKEKAAFVNLPQFLMAHGFDLKKVGREYVWKDHDSLHIKDNGPGGFVSARTRAAIISAYSENIWICPFLMPSKL